ncbi:cytochrome b [Tateyamaria sp. SN3-11]|uniref:cytochrome b n=1 Tax=Tateyamaria sp. SN3-11 TaxID=3092147 RepID=UPI0039E76523
MKTYNSISRLNHWVFALLFLGMLGFGFYLAYGSVELPQKLSLIGTHKAIGVIVLALALWRGGYRVFQGFAEPVADMPKAQKLASKISHIVLLAGITVMPVSGLMMALYSGFPTDVFGLVTIPAIDKVDSIAGAARSIHKIAAYLVTITLGMHIAAALKHHLIDRDRTLVRMIRG